MDDMHELFKKRNVACSESLDVRRESNLVYTIRDNIEYHCDIYLPDGNTGNRKTPVVFLVHGEAPAQRLKDSGPYVSLGELIASCGLAAVTFNHRMLLSGTSVTDVLDDIAKARDYIGSHATMYNIDPARSCIWAISAGMPFGIHNAINHIPEHVRCVAGYYGFGDFGTLIDVLPGAKDTAGPAPEIITGPVTFPMMIVRSGLDHKVINDSLDGFISRCLEINAHMDIFNHASGNHAFDIMDDNRRSHELIDITLIFIQKHLLL